MARARNKLEFFKLGLFFGAICATLALIVLTTVYGLSFVDALIYAILGGLFGILCGCGLTLFLAAFKINAAGRRDAQR